MMVVDLWETLGGLFKGHPDNMPEYHIARLTPRDVERCVRRFFELAQGVNVALYLRDTHTPVVALSADAAAQALAAGEIVGALLLTFPAMPEFVVYVESSHYITISYSPVNWDYISIAGFLHLFTEVKAIAPEASLVVDDTFFTDDQIARFQQVVQVHMT